MSLTNSIRVLSICSLFLVLGSPMVAEFAEELGQSSGSASSPLFVPEGSLSPAIQGFTGGSEFAIFYGGSTGDVVGFRFTMATDMAVYSLGAWDGDSQAGGAGLTSDHMVGIWDDTMTLVTSATVTPTSTSLGDFRYEDVSPAVLTAGTVYTIGAMYTATDDDGYVSGPTLTLDPEVTSLNAVFPSAGDLGFVFPTEDSVGNQGRIGPILLFGPPDSPSALEIPTLGFFGLLALLLGLGGAATAILRRRRAQ